MHSPDLVPAAALPLVLVLAARFEPMIKLAKVQEAAAPFVLTIKVLEREATAASARHQVLVLVLAQAHPSKRKWACDHLLEKLAALSGIKVVVSATREGLAAKTRKEAKAVSVGSTTAVKGLAEVNKTVKAKALVAVAAASVSKTARAKEVALETRTAATARVLVATVRAKVVVVCLVAAKTARARVSAVAARVSATTRAAGRKEKAGRIKEKAILALAVSALRSRAERAGETTRMQSVWVHPA